jgi:hypothetical protein
LPESYLEASVDTHLSVWRGAPDRLIIQSALAALMVSLHGKYLSELRRRMVPDRAEALQSHIDQEQVRQARLCDLLRIGDTERSRLQRLMFTWDRISLALCCCWQPFTVEGVPTEDGDTDIELVNRGGGTWTLGPWPFDKPVRVIREAKRLRRSYSDEASLRDDFARAELATLRFVLEASR